MSFSGVLKIQRSGRMLIPGGISGPIAIELPAFHCRLLTHTSQTGSKALAVVVPAALRAFLTLPTSVEVRLASLQQAPTEPTLEPLGESFEFIATPRLHRACAHVTVPMAWVRSILDWRLVRVEIAAHSAVVELRSNVQGVFGAVVPPEFANKPQRVRLTRVQATSLTESEDQTVFDWGVIPFAGKRVLEGDRLLLPTQRSQLSILRCTPVASTMWLLGFWLADGNKTALWFSVTNKSRVVLGKARDALLTLGVDLDVMQLGVIHGAASRDRTEAYFAPLGLKFGAVRHDPGRIRKNGTFVQREFSGHLSLRGSGEFVALANAAIERLALNKRSREARRAFLLGYLDGDGTITMTKPLRLHASCATLDEAQLISRLMDEYLERESISEPHEDGGCFPVIRSLTGFATARLIDDGAFTGNMARPRMFFFAHRVLYPERIMSVHHRWGFFDEANKPTKQLLDARKTLERHAHEWAYIQSICPDEDSSSPGVKGKLYEYDPSWKPDSAWQRVKRRQVEGDPSVHHPIEKRTQIDETLVGQQGLVIYEAHAGEGGCTAAYTKYGTVTARTHDDGNAVDVLRVQLVDPTRFDVVDLDPYGYPFDLLQEGALRLLKPTGFLFVTCPNPAKNFRGGSKRIQAALFPQGPAPFDAEAVVELVSRLGILRGMELVLASRLDLPTVWRLAFKAEPL